MHKFQILEPAPIGRKWGRLKEAAKYAGVSISMLWVWMEDGSVRYASIRRPGSQRGIRLVDLESLDHFISGFANKEEAAK